MAYLVNPGDEDHALGPLAVSLSYVNLGRKNLDALSVTETVFQFVELGYAANRVGLGTLPSDIRDATGIDIDHSDLWWHHFNVRTLLVEENTCFGDIALPAITAGVHFTYNSGIADINESLGGALTGIGLQRSHGEDFTLTATETIPEAFGCPVIATAGLRLSQAAQRYGNDFPVITVGDMVEVQRRLIDKLGIDRLLGVVGGSLGGHMALDWATRFPERVAGAVAVATSPRLTSRALAFDIVGRNAILRDADYCGGQYYDVGPGPAAGLALARMLGHITYLSREAMMQKFDAYRLVPEEIQTIFESKFNVGSYLAYQGDRFVEHFDANSYLRLREQGHHHLLGVELDEQAILACVRRGLDVVQLDLNRGLGAFADEQFDFVVLSQTLQAVTDVKRVLADMVRVGRQGIVSFPNLAYARWRAELAEHGRAPQGGAAGGFHWYDTPNVRLFSIADFEQLCAQEQIRIDQRIALNTESSQIVVDDPNLAADVAVFSVSRQQDRS